jgi:hypothetical protein
MLSENRQPFNTYGSGGGGDSIGFGDNTSNVQASSFANLQDFPRQHSAAVEVLASQFNDQTQYYQTVATSQPMINDPSFPPVAPVPSNAPESRRSPVHPGYQLSLPEISQRVSVTSHPQNERTLPRPETAEPDAFAEAFQQYEISMKQVLVDTNNSKLAEAGNSLMQLSSWLLSNAVGLGKFIHDQSLIS